MRNDQTNVKKCITYTRLNEAYACEMFNYNEGNGDLNTMDAPEFIPTGHTMRNGDHFEYRGE